MQSQKPFIVGITGGSASGKTLFLKSLLAAFPQEQITLISQDNYYRPRHEIPLDRHGVHNFDLPESIDFQQYAQHIHDLREGKLVQKLEYTFNNPEIVPALLTFQPSPIIVVEGIFVFYFEEIANMLDLKVFIDAKNKVKLNRRIRRDAEERGYDINDVLYRWEHHVKPTYQKYIKPFRAQADIVIPNNEHFEKGLDLLVHYLRMLITTSGSSNPGTIDPEQAR
ncbi:uridine kinase [Siphonobacter sp. BAB-5385]|uniref:uridine kinase n=1 Tax=unclassified Siphonobacter TaxID=2635712 RepID=UPI000B9E877A|nr:MULTISPECIES: uridine kinase [unclassified Siphonobacter]OZI08377.1 uridine kinase [Siphonobacter sp. BAB-5385]PMD96145.1 uridine kinase [Siphonobacter sp. BAB-5405]